jgi:hypothetical protein
MTTSITSAPTIVQMLSMIGYGVSYTGAPVGAFSVQISNDYTQNADGTVMNPGTWSTITLQYLGLPVTSIPVSGAGNGFIDITDTAAYAIRLVYTATSGSGTLTATINAKVQ